MDYWEEKRKAEGALPSDRRGLCRVGCLSILCILLRIIAISMSGMRIILKILELEDNKNTPRSVPEIGLSFVVSTHDGSAKFGTQVENRLTKTTLRAERELKLGDCVRYRVLNFAGEKETCYI